MADNVEVPETLSSKSEKELDKVEGKNTFLQKSQRVRVTEILRVLRNPVSVIGSLHLSLSVKRDFQCNSV